jgi:DNA-binding HxlR family transcriptional regulator
MRPKRLDSRSGCAVEVTLSVIGGLWKPLILFHLLRDKKRFMELTRLMPNTTQRMLTLQLRELETDGIIARHVYPQVPPKVEYELTPFGKTLAPVLFGLREWGEAYQARYVGHVTRIEPTKLAKVRAGRVSTRQRVA